MNRMTLLLVLFLLLPDLYIYFVHIVRSARRKALRLAYWLPSIALLLTYIYYMLLGGDNALSEHPQAIGRLVIGLMAFVIPKVLFILCSLVGVVAHGVVRACPRTPFTGIGLLLGILCFVNVLYGHFAGITQFDVKEVDYHSAHLPKGFDGYRIVQISDIHIGSWKEDPAAVQRMVDLVNAQEADLIVFTGDLVNQQSHELDGFQSILSQLHAPDGVYSILGNHDYGTYYHWKNKEKETENLSYLLEQQKAMGWKLLKNEHAIIHHQGDSIALIGVENDGEPPFSQYADLPRAMQGTDGMFRILLSHNPTHWRREVLSASDIELMLAGHTHAFQMELFGYSPSALKYPEWSGMYREGEQSLYVNVGIGYVGMPFRFGAWPEITVFQLTNDK